MELPRLRRLLQQIVVAGLPLAAGASIGCGSEDGDDIPDDCYVSYDATVVIEPPSDATLQLEIDRCRADSDTCWELCRQVIEEQLGEYGLQACAVTFEGDTTRVAVSYGSSGCDVGRRPPGLVAASEPAARSAAGAWLARAAWLEGASIHAFVQLAAELASRGAPITLVAAARAFAADEVRHAVVMTQLAHRYGARPSPVEVARPAPRSLEAMAIENATEGCVRETWGAVVALWQAHAATDPAIRTALATIANDEARHAALAWQIDAWLSPQLDAAARARVAQARTLAAAAVLVEHAALATFPGAVDLGLPVDGAAQQLAQRAHVALWA